jgi:hypothetical protein
VIGAAYFDESGDEENPGGRIGIAGALGTTDQWLGFEGDWRGVLDDAHVTPGDFHAVQTSSLQVALSDTCARLVKKWNIITLCVTLRESDYERCTNQLQRGWYGDAYGFARYVCFMTVSAKAKTRDGDIGYYVEQGGKGFDWIMEHFGIVYRDDKQRANRRMAAYGPVDRRIHLPVHVPDLVAHEVITARQVSKPLVTLGGLVSIFDINEDEIDDLVHGWTKDQMMMMSLKEQARRDKRRDLKH